MRNSFAVPRKWSAEEEEELGISIGDDPKDEDEDAATLDPAAIWQQRPGLVPGPARACLLLRFFRLLPPSGRLLKVLSVRGDPPVPAPPPGDSDSVLHLQL